MLRNCLMACAWAFAGVVGRTLFVQWAVGRGGMAVCRIFGNADLNCRGIFCPPQLAAIVFLDRTIHRAPVLFYKQKKFIPPAESPTLFCKLCR